MISQTLYKTLRLARGWLIATMCLSLTFPFACYASVAKEGAACQFEISARDLDIEQLYGPIETTVNKELSTQAAASLEGPADLVMADRLPPCSFAYLHNVDPTAWTSRFFRPFLPRPPPLS